MAHARVAAGVAGGQLGDLELVVVGVGEERLAGLEVAVVALAHAGHGVCLCFGFKIRR